MMQAALDDEDVLAAIGEGKPPAIGDRALRRAFELRKQPGGQVHAFEPREAEPLQVLRLRICFVFRRFCW